MAEHSALRDEPWYAAANVEGYVLKYLQQDEGCIILSSGNPATLGPGVEIVVAEQEGEQRGQRLISVIGWPDFSGDTDNAEYESHFRPEVVSRSWLANALLDLLLGRGADPDVGLGLALPAIAGYIRYLQRLRWLLMTARIAVYLVSQEGRVTLVETEPQGAADNHPQAGAERRKLGLPGASRLHMPLLRALVAAGGAASRSDLIPAVARLFAEVPDPPPSEFGQRLSIAQTQMQSEGLTELQGRGIWRITDKGRSRVEAEQP